MHGPTTDSQEPAAIPEQLGFSFENLARTLEQLERQTGKRPGESTRKCWMIVTGSLGLPVDFDAPWPKTRDGQRQEEESYGLYRIPAGRVGGFFGSHDLERRGYDISDPTGQYTPEVVAEAFKQIFTPESTVAPPGFIALLVSGVANYRDRNGAEHRERHLIAVVNGPQGIGVVDSLADGAYHSAGKSPEAQLEAAARYVFDRVSGADNLYGLDWYFAVDEQAYRGWRAQRPNSTDDLAPANGRG